MCKNTDVHINDLVHKSNATVALGCVYCPEQEHCGGIAIAEPVFSCLDFCTCDDSDACPYICPKQKMRESVLARREVHGWDLLNLRQLPSLPYNHLPLHAPLIDGWSGRSDPVPGQFFAIPLKRLFHGKTGKPLFNSLDEVRTRFKIDPSANVIVDGVSTDQPIENFWGRARDAGIVDNLKRLSPSVVTVPNFSMFANVPRFNDLYNMKRQVVAWHEITAAGLRAALHVNARTDQDYRRFAEFLRQQPAVQVICFEFGTGGRRPTRRQWYVDWLCQLPELAGRDLSIIVRGGLPAVKQLSKYFRHLTFIDTMPIRKTMRRRRKAHESNRYRRTFTLRGQPLDDLLEKNIADRKKWVEKVMRDNA